jgi:hypothetical protein
VVDMLLAAFNDCKGYIQRKFMCLGDFQILGCLFVDTVYALVGCPKGY